MKCMSNELYCILPPRLRSRIASDELPALQEIRLRIDKPVSIRTDTGIKPLDTSVTKDDLSFVINAASHYSPWNAVTAAKGYLTAPGGHRIGICGDVVVNNGQVQGIRTPTSICIRVAKDFPGIGRAVDLRDSILILGPPGSGKTTLLRDLIRRICNEDRGTVSVVDERAEIFPHVGGKPCFDSGNTVDILTGCCKPCGIEMVLRSMGPDWIAVDEITAVQDCEALSQAGWCGVKLLATAHASGVQDLMQREIYRSLVQMKLFRHVVILRRDKSMTIERMIL